MTITFPIAIPTSTGLASIVMRARSVVAMSRSPFTGEQQVQVYPGQWWEMEVHIPAGRRDVIGEWVAFLLSLNGMEGTFLLGDPDGTLAQGSAATSPGTPVINGASQAGQYLNIDGLPTGAVGYLLPNDYIALGTGGTTRLHKVLQQVDSDSIGEATVTIWPRLRESPTDGATVIVASTKGRFRLASNVSECSINEALIYGLSFNAVEDL